MFVQMKRYLKTGRRITLLLVCLTSLLLTPGTASADPGKTDTLAPAKPAGASVAPFGKPIFNIYARLGPYSPADRAKNLEEKILNISKDPFFHSDSIRLFAGETTYDVVYGQSVLTSVGDADAAAEGTSRELVARERMAKIIYAIRQYRMVNSPSEIFKNILISAGILLLLVIVITLVTSLFKKISARADAWQAVLMQKLHMQDWEFFNRQRQIRILLLLIRMVKYLVILLLLMITMLGIFYLLPWTKVFSFKILGFILDPLRKILHGLWDYVPSLITILVIIVVARLIIRFFRFLKSEVERETLRIPGFYPEWALPTFNILRVLVIVFTLVAVWPYLHGSGSQVFQGISVFFGIVFSLTSASSLSNFMAGLTITYTRAFKLGDRVKIGEVTGDIVGKTMLVTKIRTIKNEEITVPNTKIMTSEVINFSTCAPDLGLILHTTVTIGYDTPWREVHRLLIEAALATDQVLKSPEPFVLQTALNDFYVSYQLNIYTRSSNGIAAIFSQLHQNIQDSFNNAGMEIMSPHYRAVRDGNTMAIPEENRGPGYKTPGFRMEGK